MWSCRRAARTIQLAKFLSLSSYNINIALAVGQRPTCHLQNTSLTCLHVPVIYVRDLRKEVEPTRGRRR